MRQPYDSYWTPERILKFHLEEEYIDYALYGEGDDYDDDPDTDGDLQTD